MLLDLYIVFVTFTCCVNRDHDDDDDNVNVCVAGKLGSGLQALTATKHISLIIYRNFHMKLFPYLSYFEVLF